MDFGLLSAASTGLTVGLLEVVDMTQWRVGDVMTKEVVTVTADTPYRGIVDVLLGRRVSAVPVVDYLGRVLGVVSETDLLHQVEFSDQG